MRLECRPRSPGLFVRGRPPKRGYVRGSGFRVQDLQLKAQGSGLRAQGSGFRVQGSGFRVQGLGFTSCGERKLHVSRQPRVVRRQKWRVAGVNGSMVAHGAGQWSKAVCGGFRSSSVCIFSPCIQHSLASRHLCILSALKTNKH